jgi:hypothetical protein
MEELMKLLWPSENNKHMIEASLKLLHALKEKKALYFEEARAIIGGKQRPTTIVKKLKNIWLIETKRDPKTKKVVLSLSFSSYKAFVNKFLIDKVSKFFEEGEQNASV